MRHPLLDAAETSSLRETPLRFSVGDTVDVHTRRSLEGEKERIQIFTGVVIATRGAGTRRCSPSAGSSPGRAWSGSFPTNSPKIAKVVVKRHGRVRRAKLFYLRDRVGKATRLRERAPRGRARSKCQGSGLSGVIGRLRSNFRNSRRASDHLRVKPFQPYDNRPERRQASCSRSEPLRTFSVELADDRSMPMTETSRTVSGARRRATSE